MIGSLNQLKKYIVFILILVYSSTGLGQTKRIRPAAQHVIFKAKLFIDPVSEKTLKDVAIEVNNGRILSVAGSQDIQIHEETNIIDFGDRVIIPGLIDTHGHLFGGVTTYHKTCEMHAAFYLAAGVTTVRSPGSMEPEGDLGLQRRIDSGRFIGPRYFHSGPYIEGEPVSVGWMQPVKTPEEVRLKIDQWIKQGATSIKIYASMEGEVLKTAIEHGHAHGVKVIGHIDDVTYKEAMEMGIDELFHGTGAMPDIVTEDLAKIDRRKDYKTFYTTFAEMALDETTLKAIAKMASEYRVVITPTADVVEPLEMARNHMEEQKKYYTPEAWERVIGRIENPIVPGGERMLEKNKRFIKLAHEAGCILTTGTDQVGFSMLPGFSLWREMEIFEEAGLKPMEVLRAATIHGAYAIGRSDLLGSVEPGKLADFVVLDANPLEDISHVRKVHKVVKGGLLYDPEKLLSPLVGKYE